MEATYDLEELLERDDFDHSTYQQLCQLVHQSTRERARLAVLLEQMGQRAERTGAASPGAALRLALGLLLVHKRRQAVEWFEKAPAGKEKHYYFAQTLRKLGQHDLALAELDAAAAAGWDKLDCVIERTQILLGAGRLEEAQTHLDSKAAEWSDHPRTRVARGLLLERRGQYEQAADQYARVLDLDPDYVDARFRLAYVLDLRGHEEEAVGHYEQCVAAQPAHINALMNLAIVYEDLEDYEGAQRCLQQVVQADPNHARARLFLKDVQSAEIMLIDEDQERAKEKRDAILDTPITEFELSVRSRNCLHQMNINTLGDLLRISEAELLAYKNFGETSLVEIRNMLDQKSLRLGQLLEEQQTAARQKALETVTAHGVPDMLDKPVNELELSVRSRKCLQRLNIESLGDLTSRTEAELLGAKNFGKTSLNEVKQRLTEFGLSLRKIEQ